VSLAAASAIVVAATAIIVDFATWIQLNVTILSGIPLVLAAPTRNRWLLWGLVIALLAATFLVYSLQIPPGVFSLRESFFVKRLSSFATMLLTAYLLHLWMNALEVVDTQRWLLAE
jgi:hypothetical protein